MATNLAPALNESGAQVVEVWSKSRASAETLAGKIGCSSTWGDLSGVTREADIYIIAVKDAALADVASHLHEGREQALMVHTAGSMPISVFADAGHARAGVFYPMQTFSKERQVDFARRPKHGERLDVVTSIYDFKGPLGYRNTLIRDEAGELVASSWAIGPFVSLDTGKMVRIPQEVLDEITFDPKFDMEYLPKKIKLPAVEPNKLEPFETRYTDIDLNMHVNNVQYVRMAYDCLPDGQLDFKRLRIEYKGQARFGQTIHPIMYRDDERTIVVLNNDEGAPYTLVEFS